MDKIFYNISLLFVFFCYVLVKGVNGTVNCRNNNNEPVDWWVLYKPPPGEGVSGRNFSYVLVDPVQTSDSAAGRRKDPWSKLRRWRSLMDITLPNMLHFTIAPIYKKSLSGRVAALSFDGSEASHPSSARGLLLADKSGGLYLAHTVPDLVDLTLLVLVPQFPESEISNGHMIVCVSMDLKTLNNVGLYVKHAAPKVQLLQMPNSLMKTLASWFYVNSDPITTLTRIHTTPMEFTNGKLIGLLMVRRPKQTHCIYKTFAMHQGVILDVYAPSHRPKKNICEDYGVRSIDSISLNVYGEDVFVQYVDNSTDRAKFAVSTASYWQRRIPGQEQYWSCYSGLGRDADTGKGGLLLCLNNYLLWNAMDTLKVKEPECPL